MSITDKDRWYNWYKNIIKYLQYRKETPLEELTKEDVVKGMINNNLINIKSKKIQIILTNPNGKYSSINNESKKKINEVLAVDKVEELIYLADITYIGDKGVIISSTVKKLLDEVSSNNPNIWVQIRPYTLMTNDVLASTEMVPHYRIDQSKIKAELEETMTPLSSLPMIKEWDPGVAWIGARAGEIIGIERLSGSVGSQMIYRRVVL